MIMEIISIVLGFFLLGAIDYADGTISPSGIIFYIDPPSLIIVLVLAVPILFTGGMWQDFLRAWKLLKKNYTCHLSEIRRSLDVVEMMQKQLVYAGIISMLLSFVHVLGRLSDPASLGPNVAVAVLTMLYAVVFEMLLLPLQMEAKRRIVDYMEVDTDVESTETPMDRAEGRKVSEEKSETGKESAAEKKGTETAAITEDGRI